MQTEVTRERARAARRSDAVLAGRLAHAVRARPATSQGASFVLWLVATVVATLLCNELVAGFEAQPPWGPLLFAVVLGVTGLLLQPLMVAGAVRLGWVGVVGLAMLGQSLIVATAAWVLPEVRVDTLWAAFLVATIIGVVGTVIGWLSTAGTDEALVGRLVSSGRRRRTPVEDPDVPGVVFVQFDGVPYPILQMGAVSGTLPTLARWMRSGSHVLHEWTPKLPATTPASQMGILHGVIDGIPAFRWYDRSRDKVIVTNRPSDARFVETALSTGRGLLVDGGVSISNLFSGDAPYSALTMSRRAGDGEVTQRAAAQFVSHPGGLTRALSRSASELARDRFQARRAVRRDVLPRCHRSWTTALLRSVTNGALRDLNTTLVAQHMLRGTRSIYVDYVDFDEVAHHAGMLRSESLEALESIDGALRQLELVASVAPRDYKFVVLSDHGQAQGTTFLDRYGEDLAAVVARLAGTVVASSTEDIEGWARTGALVDDLAVGGGLRARTMRNAAGAMQRHDRNEPERIDANPSIVSAPIAAGEETFHVFGSGNLGLVYVRGERQRLTRQQIDERFPALVRGLAAHPGIGFVAVLDDVDGPVALGAAGQVRLADGRVTGTDPLAPFGPHARAFVLRVASREEAPDIYVNSLVDPGTEEVAAFEGLVGCHGGLGGWQDRAFVMVPSDVPFPAEPVVGADAMHVALTGVLRHLGHRGEVDDSGATGPAVPMSGPVRTGPVVQRREQPPRVRSRGRPAVTSWRDRIDRARRVLEASFMGRWLELLLEIQFVDRSVALAAKSLLALLPALVTVAAVAPDNVRQSMVATLERRMGLSGASLELVRAGFSSGPGKVSAGVVGGLLTIFYATTFASALRRMYLRTWRRPPMRDRLIHVKGLVWLGTMIVLFSAAAVLRDWLSGFPGWIFFLVIAVAVTVAMWWATSFLMLRGHIRWRVLLPPALITAAGSGLYGAAAALWMPRSVILNNAQYGYFGVFMTIVSWLVGLAFVVVCATALGPVLAEDRGAIGRLVRGRVDATVVPGCPASLSTEQSQAS